MKKGDKSVILIVDDKPANILVLENLLAARGRVLLNATSGEEALKITLNSDVDLIILDVQMPGMDGFEVAQILKTNNRTKNIPIIFATAESKEKRLMMKGYDEGAVDYLLKPLDPEVVKAKVNVLLKIQLQKKELVEKNLSLEKSALLINNSADIIGIIDADTLKIEQINNAFSIILGYSAEDIKGTSLPFYLGNEDRALIQSLQRQSKERLSFETRIYCSSRAIKWLQWNVAVKNGKWLVNARDITEEKQVERIRNYLATVVKQSNDAIYIHDYEGKIISWNQGAENIYGYSEKEALKMKIWNIIPQYLESETEKIFSEILKGEKVQALETRRITKHGKLIDVLFSASIITDPANDQVSIAITESDITQQKMAAEQIKESEKRFRDLFEYAPFPMWVYDLNSLRFLEVNHTSTALYGYSRDEFLGMKITDIRPEEEVQRLMEHIHQRNMEAWDQTNLQVQSSSGWKHRLRNGQIIDVEITSHLLDYKHHKAALVIAKDVTEQKRADREIRELNDTLQKNIFQLRESEEQIQTIVRNAPDAVVVINEEGKITSWNPRAEAIFGWTAGEVASKYLHEIIIPERYRQAHREGIKHFLKTGEGPVLNKPIELPALKKDNTEFDAGISISPTVIKGENYFIGFISDITYRKKAEREIEQANRELEKTVQQLNEVNKELESFSYSVSHDLRAPLRALSGYSKILEEDYTQVLDNEAKRMLGNIKKNALKMGVLIDDLLAFSRLGRKEVQKSKIRMDNLVEEVLEEVSKAITHKAKIKMHPLLPADADHGLLHQVWVNLISNAIKYSEKKTSPEVEIGSSDTGIEITYYVKDNGAGFDMNYADKLFGVFQRLHNPNEFEGTGVGLAIVHRIITKHGGRIWAEAIVDKGATFYFTLPKTINNTLNHAGKK